MARRGHNEEAILRVLREAESGETVVEICRKHGISQQTFYLWKKKYSFDPLLLSFRRTQSGGDCEGDVVFIEGFLSEPCQLPSPAARPGRSRPPRLYRIRAINCNFLPHNLLMPMKHTLPPCVP